MFAGPPVITRLVVFSEVASSTEQALMDTVGMPLLATYSPPSASLD